MAEPLVQARGLTKRFGDFVAVDAVDFDIGKGEAFGFLGPNGAGKTSTMKMITTVSPITEGKLTVFGLDPDAQGRQIRQRLGVVPQEDNLDLELTVAENLYVYGRYHDMHRADIKARIVELLEFAQLTDRADSPVEPLSGGMKRRLTIARALINDPDLVILDEPTTGPRSPGPPSPLGPALPPQAGGGDPDHHHPLHGRGRAALRPAGGHGQGQDRGGRLAAGAHRRVRPPRSGRASLPEGLRTRWRASSIGWKATPRSWPTA